MTTTHARPVTEYHARLAAAAGVGPMPAAERCYVVDSAEVEARRAWGERLREALGGKKGMGR